MSSYVIGDMHLGHQGIVRFSKEDGSKLRPWDTIEEHDSALIDNWNSVVNDKDLVYVLGDFTMNPRCIIMGTLLKGRKKLVLGNHDTGSIQQYIDAGFESLHGSIELVKRKIIMSHIPVHRGQVVRYSGGCIHGHLHDHQVLREDGVVDEKYLCVSAEHTAFTPLKLEEAIERLKGQQKCH